MALSFNNVTYKSNLKKFNYDFEDGKITTIVSGESLSYFTYLISNLEKDYNGKITNTYKGRNIGVVFNNPEEAFIFNTVREELEFGLKKYNYKVSTINKRIEDSLKMVNLPKEYLDKSPFELSSGEKESLALGIVLSLNPKLIIIDNPTSNLDSRNKEYLIKLLKKIKTRYNKTIILLTSDIEFTIKVTDNYLILKNDKIISSGVKKELLNNISKIKTSKVEIPKIIDFINAVKKKKNINLELTFDVKELMKDIVMLNNITIGRYINKSSVVHKLNPVFKIISLIIMIISIFFIDSYIDITLLSMYLLLTMLYSDIDIKVYLKNIYGIKIFLIFIFIIDLIFFTSINRIIFDIFKLIFIVLYSSILTYTTSITELTFGIEKLLRPFNKLIPVGDIAMIITLSIRYIPTLTEEASRIIKAQKLRGINFDTKNIKEKIISISGILMPMFSLSIKRAEESADIMDIRLYNYGKSRTNYRTNKWTKINSLLLILNILMLIIIIYY